MSALGWDLSAEYKKRFLIELAEDDELGESGDQESEELSDE